MAIYKQGSRYVGSVEGEFRGETVVFPRFIDYNELEYVATHTVQAKDQYRPDLISQSIYGRDDLGWFILQANNMDNVFQLKTGVTLGIPKITGVII